MSSSNWAPIDQYAVVVHPFISQNPNELTVLAGDYLHVTFEGEEWVHATNIRSFVAGAVPKCILSEYLPSEVALMTSEHDLLLREASHTLKAALDFLLQCSPLETLSVSQATFQAVDLLNQIKSGPADVSYIRRMLAKSLDELRIALDLTVCDRNSTFGVPSLTTWGRESYLPRHELVPVTLTSQEYVLIRTHMRVPNLRRPTLFRIVLYKRQKHPWLSLPVSALLTPERPSFDALFDQIDVRDSKDPLSLVVYAFDVIPNRQGFIREPFACSVIPLPSYRSRSAYKTPSLRVGQVFTTVPESLMKLHSRYLAQNTAAKDTDSSLVERVPLSLECTFTAFFGSSNEVIKENSLETLTKVYPLYLPAISPVNSKRHTLSVTLARVEQHSARKRSSIMCRLFDRVSNTFVKAIENPVTGECIEELWESAIFKGRDVPLCETFNVNLSKAEHDMSQLSIVLQVVRRNFGDENVTVSSECRIPLDDIPKNEHNFQLLHVSGKANEGKVVGNITAMIVVSSDKITQDETLNALMQYPEGSSNIPETKLMDHLKEADFFRFLKPVLFSLCLMMTKKELTEQAYSTFIYVLSEVHSKAPTEYTKVLDEFVTEKFIKGEDRLTRLYVILTERIQHSLDMPDTSQEFRAFLKCLPYLFKIIGASYPLSETHPEEKEFKRILSAVFEKLNNIVKECPPENDTQRISMVFTNQGLLLGKFAQYIEAMDKCLSPLEIAKITADFIKSVCTTSTGKRQTAVDKNKMRLIQTLAGTRLWKDEVSRGFIKPVFLEQLKTAEKLPTVSELLPMILAALFSAVRDDFILSFLHTLSKEWNQTSVKLLLMVAFAFPSKFDQETLMKLCQSEFVPANDRFVTVMHCLANHSAKPSVGLVNSILELAVTALSETADFDDKKISKLDREINQILYPSKVNYEALTKIVSQIPMAERHIDIVSLIHVCMLGPSDSLRSIVDMLPDSVESLVMAIRGLVGKPGFGRVYSLFEGIPRYKQVRDAAYALHLIDTLKTDLSNEDALIESCITLREVYKSIGNNDLVYKETIRLIKLHHGFKNNVEEANAILELDKFLSSNNEKIDKDKVTGLPFFTINSNGIYVLNQSKRKEIKYYRELIWQLLTKAIELLSEASHHEFALPIIELLKEKCINTVRHYELLPSLASIESSLYTSIDTGDSQFANYFLVKFPNQGFGKTHQGRAFVYRVSSKENQATFVSRLQKLHPQGTVVTDPSDKSENSILAEKVVPVKSDDPFILPDDQLPRSTIEFLKHQNATIFKSENRYVYYRTRNSLPWLATRSEVVPEQTTERELNEVDTSVIFVDKRTFDLKNYLFEFHQLKTEKIELSFYTKVTNTLGLGEGSAYDKICKIADKAVEWNDERLFRALRDHLAAAKTILAIEDYFADVIAGGSTRASLGGDGTNIFACRIYLRKMQDVLGQF